MDRNLKYTIKRLLEELTRGAARYEGGVEALVASAKAAAASIEAVTLENEELEKKVADTNDRVRDADLRTARIADAASRYYDAVESGAASEVVADCGKRLLQMCASGGTEKPVSRYSEHLRTLLGMARSEAWGAITVGEDKDGHIIHTRTVVTWQGHSTFLDRHPRECIRILMREVFGHDVDANMTGTFFDANGNRISDDFDDDDDDE